MRAGYQSRVSPRAQRTSERPTSTVCTTEGWSASAGLIWASQFTVEEGTTRLHQVHRNELVGLSNGLDDEVTLAPSQAASHTGAGGRRDGGVKRIDVER